MATPQIDLEANGGHVNGDEDGLGAPRGMLKLFMIEVAAALLYGIALHFGIWR